MIYKRHFKERYVNLCKKLVMIHASLVADGVEAGYRQELPRCTFIDTGSYKYLIVPAQY